MSNLVRIDREAVGAWLLKHGYDADSVRRQTKISSGTVRRLAGWWDPPSCPPHRLDSCSKSILGRLCQGLKIPEHEIVVDAPVPVREPRPDGPPTYPNDRRTQATAYAARRAADEAELAEHLDEAS
jgi:hypothetical protein